MAEPIRHDWRVTIIRGIEHRVVFMHGFTDQSITEGIADMGDFLIPSDSDSIDAISVWKIKPKPASEKR